MLPILQSQVWDIKLVSALRKKNKQKKFNSNKKCNTIIIVNTAIPSYFKKNIQNLN